MRKKIVAGNWKMNTTVPEGVQLAKEVVEKAKEVPAGVGLIVATPFTHLCSVAEVVTYLRGFSPIWRDLMAGKKEFIL